MIFLDWILAVRYPSWIAGVSVKCQRIMRRVVPVEHHHHTMFPGGLTSTTKDTVDLLLSWSKSVLTLDLRTTDPSMTDKLPELLSSKAQTLSLTRQSSCSRRPLISWTFVPWLSLANLYLSLHSPVRIPRAQLPLQSQVPRLRTAAFLLPVDQQKL